MPSTSNLKVHWHTSAAGSGVHLQLETSEFCGQEQDGELAAVAVHAAGATVDETTTGTNMSVGVPTELMTGGAGKVIFADAEVEVDGEIQLASVFPGVHG
jgi:hypothetical protein